VTDTLTFWWSTAGTDYFFDYEANCRKVTWEDISSLIRKYLIGEASAASGTADSSLAASARPPAATLVRLRSSTFSADPRMDSKIIELGYTRVTADNAFWWQK
jgi:hypothetical protein